MTTRKNMFKQEWKCEKYPSCLYCIPCDCNNCVKFEKTLEKRVCNKKTARTNLKKDHIDLQKHHLNYFAKS